MLEQTLLIHDCLSLSGDFEVTQGGVTVDLNVLSYRWYVSADGKESNLIKGHWLGLAWIGVPA
ncbi:hypothetical protein [Thalassolituus oleivorans]|uniref:Uncharacterized protein n=1 Tax=Thalassolituus oleivorans MIL-1 TaxID=1298593 RepID=M5DZ36_9GAMM|nr:hypothetical protein [Thalassolituus oleivorans]CCU70789.1 hypothetical protein TOL_0346 [Thalassolituus oleivorans MIL-1]